MVREYHFAGTLALSNNRSTIIERKLAITFTYRDIDTIVKAPALEKAFPGKVTDFSILCPFTDYVTHSGT